MTNVYVVIFSYCGIRCHIFSYDIVISYDVTWHMTTYIKIYGPTGHFFEIINLSVWRLTKIFPEKKHIFFEVWILFVSRGQTNWFVNCESIVHELGSVLEVDFCVITLLFRLLLLFSHFTLLFIFTLLPNNCASVALCCCLRCLCWSNWLFVFAKVDQTGWMCRLLQNCNIF